MRGSAARALLPALVVLALVGVVAVAARGSTSEGNAGVRPPSATVLDTILSLGLLAAVVGAVLLAYGLTQRKAIAAEIATGRYRRTSVVGYIAFFAVLMAITYWRLRSWHVKPADAESNPAFPGLAPRPGLPADASETTYRPQFAWLPVAVVIGLAALAAVAYVVANRRARLTGRAAEALSEQLADVLDETLDDLRAEKDPRRAVIAAYARLERVFAANGSGRRPAETPEEYLGRVLGDLTVDGGAVRRLTELFSQAKFSQHVVNTAMKEEAIEALAQVRDELREAAADREAAQTAALAGPTGARS
jgi:hypothetical protein